MTRPPPELIPRFTAVERWVHRSSAVLVGVLAATGATLYVEQLSLLIGRRPLVEGLHIAAGLLLPVPALLGLATSPELRADLGALGRLTGVDRVWLRRRDRRTAGLPVGKFNAGQKLLSALVAGAGLVLFGTGLLLIAPARINLPVGTRTGATFVHDVFTFALLVLLAGHVWMAMRHPEARAAMRTGVVDRDYAEAEHAGWAATVPPPPRRVR